MERNGGSQGQKGVPTDAPVITSTPFTPNATKGIEATAGPSRRQLDGDSLPTVDSKFSMPHACSAGGIQCVCFNCDADSRGLKCCIDLLEPRALQEGVAITIDSITIRKFLEIEESVRQVTEKELADACQRIDCFGVSKSLKRRRRDKDGKESLHSVTNVSVVLFSILPDAPAHSKGGLTAAFYATVTSHMAASNRTKVLNGAVLADLMREKQEVLNKQLNISIGVIASWDSTNIGILSIKPGGSPSEGKESTAEDKEHMSYTIFIIILVSGIVGFLVLTAAFIFIGIRFQRRRNGEFIPTEIYTDGARRPSTPRIVVSFATDGTSGTQCTRAGQRKELRRKSTGSAGVLDEGRGARRSSTVSLGETPSLSRFVDQLYPSSVDPSTPRITDVPKKSVRRGSMGTWSTNSYEDQRILSSTSSITGLPKKQIRRGSEGTGNADGCEEQPMPLSFVYPISATTHGMPKNLAMNNPDKNSARIPTKTSEGGDGDAGSRRSSGGSVAGILKKPMGVRVTYQPPKWD
ncbi:uncharacterized protein LOC116601495 [Nematostella vectensis]|uniref:uncharacterized protein LOC116601495 n=1 Tax=Nematostella vectensis TaxID=45351 RepID=UPI002076FD2A|nr:uncharacterized protein LOC116601495 [Nematostella vectensis]